MSELDELRRYLADGFQPAMILRDVKEDELRRVGLPEAYYSGVVKALPLAHADGRRSMFYLKEQDAIEFARELVRDLRTIIGYTLCLCCTVIGPDTIEGRDVALGQVITRLREILGWDVRKSAYPHALEIVFDIEGDDQSKVKTALDQSRDVCLALSLRNKLGFVVRPSSGAPRYKGQPFSIISGPAVNVGCRIDPDDLAKVARISADEAALKAAQALQAIYSGVTDDVRVTVAWSAIEELFGSKPKHLLDANELSAVQDAIDSVAGLDADKREALRKKLADSSLMSKESRNERIASEIGTLLGRDSAEMLKQIRDLTTARAKRVHSLRSREGSIAQHVAFVESVLLAYIESRVQAGTATSGPHEDAEIQP
jgi:hypothetical protein